MITVEILEHIDSLTQTIKEDYEKSIHNPVYNVGNGYVWSIPNSVSCAYIISPSGKTTVINALQHLTEREIRLYTQVLEKTFNDRLENEGSIFNVLVTSLSTKYSLGPVICYKLDYSVYTGNENTDLLNI